MHTVAIIGSAGRRDDGPKMSRELYEAMCKTTITIIDDIVGESYCAVSGGAAWADHVAIRLYMTDHAKALRLYLPAFYDHKRLEFKGTKSRDPGSITNYYHSQFSRHMGGNTLRGIKLALDKGAENLYVPGEGFKPRNLRVGKVDTVVAFTFGTGDHIEIFTPPDPGWYKAQAAGLKPGGTSHTWDNSSASMKIHIPLNTLRIQ